MSPFLSHALPYLQGNVEGGENYDWYYASEADRESQIRTPIDDTGYGEHWVFRPKDLRGWWSNQHFDRIYLPPLRCVPRV